MNKKKKIIFDWLNEIYSSCSLHKHNDYPNSIFFKKDNIILGEKDEKNKYFWVSYDDVWNYIGKMFTMDSEEVRTILREWLNNNGIKSVSYGIYNSEVFNDELSPKFTDVFCDKDTLNPLPLTGPLSRALDDKDKLSEYIVMPVNSHIFGCDGFTPMCDTNIKIINKIISNES